MSTSAFAFAFAFASASLLPSNSVFKLSTAVFKSVVSVADEAFCNGIGFLRGIDMNDIALELILRATFGRIYILEFNPASSLFWCLSFSVVQLGGGARTLYRLHVSLMKKNAR